MSLQILGVMTGTSCDGLDAACIEMDSQGWTPLWESSAPYPLPLRKRVLNFQKKGASHQTWDWLSLNRDLGEWYGNVLSKMIRARRSKPDLIANHGQTVAHFPEKNRMGMTLQMGDGTRIAAATGLTTICQFREGDMAAGGQGAPLIPQFHALLGFALNQGMPGVSIHNIGGISNLTYLGPEGKVLAFDTGPGNIWIDASVSKASRGKNSFDVGGRLAQRGKVHAKVLREALKHPFFSKPLPKSTGRDEFPFALFDSLAAKYQVKDKGTLVATATQVTIDSISSAYQRYILKKHLPLKSIFLCGGGAKNLAILEGLKMNLPGVKVSSLDAIGFKSQYVEAQGFAVLGFMTLMGAPLGGTWTGAKGFAPPAHVIPGKNWSNVMAKLSREMSSWEKLA